MNVGSFFAATQAALLADVRMGDMGNSLTRTMRVPKKERNNEDFPFFLLICSSAEYHLTPL